MEFSDVGEHCSIQGCEQLDFLPFVCEHCSGTFCKAHFHTVSHDCSKLPDNSKTAKPRSTGFVCAWDSCEASSPVEMPCTKCAKHFCVAHRHHGCLEPSVQEKTKKLKKWQIPKKQFAEAKAVVDEQVSESLKKSKNVTMANKVQLMRVKGSAVGPKNVPLDERCYFLVYSPITLITKFVPPPKGIYVNSNWTIGKAIDTMADVLKLPNANNTTSTSRLRLFHHSSGTIVCDAMDTLLTELFESQSLVDGQKVILEYSDKDSVEKSLYK